MTQFQGAAALPRAVVPDDRGSAGGGRGSSLAPWTAGTHFSHYEIESLLASGGMAEVWRAKIKGAEGFEKRVVIKTMLTQYSHRADLVEMFVREATLTAQLSHPNIVDVFDFGQLEGRYFIAMEYVPGVTLRFAHRRMLARGARLPVAMILHVMKDVCEALQHVHDLEDSLGPMGVVHRDLSPDNIILSTSSTAKLIDFGAARATARTPMTSLFVGKYRYAAPERIRMQGEDYRSDLYSVGVILFECLTGVRPFDGPEPEVIRAVTSSRGCDPRREIADLPASVAELVLKATAPNGRDRFEDASELGGAIGRCLAELRAQSKEREVTAGLSVVLDSTAADASRDPGGPATAEGVPEVIGETSDRPSRRTSEDSSVAGEAAFHEMEIVEASGPIRRLAAPASTGTPSASPRISTASFLTPAVSAAATPPPQMVTPPPQPTSSLQQAVELFDRGVALRTEHRFSEALAVWERALDLAPENRVYDANVRRLREELDAMDKTPPPVEFGNEDTTAVSALSPDFGDESGRVGGEEGAGKDEGDTAKVNVDEI